MKIFAISVIKNEANSIRQSLLAVAVWADQMFVDDNGSPDGTWEIVRVLAREKSSQIVPWKQEANPFCDVQRRHPELYKLPGFLAKGPRQWQLAYLKDYQSAPTGRICVPAENAVARLAYIAL